MSKFERKLERMMRGHAYKSLSSLKGFLFLVSPFFFLVR